MARPVRETPILHGKAAKRFLERMKDPKKETLERARERWANYDLIMSIFEKK
jgi:hypothetical protein